MANTESATGTTSPPFVLQILEKHLWYERNKIKGHGSKSLHLIHYFVLRVKNNNIEPFVPNITMLLIQKPIRFSIGPGPEQQHGTRQTFRSPELKQRDGKLFHSKDHTIVLHLHRFSLASLSACLCHPHPAPMARKDDTYLEGGERRNETYTVQLETLTTS
ncbi:hypothetical protein QQP08_009354 [Theobroma cacao]|nr:hypothetical protein QQP08_009354 [Theobroma cacao]